MTIPYFLLIVSLPIAFLVARRSGNEPDADDRQRHRALACFALAALSFYAAYILGISLVSFPFERYFVSTVVFIPPLLAVVLTEAWSGILRGWRDGRA